MHDRDCISEDDFLMLIPSLYLTQSKARILLTKEAQRCSVATKNAINCRKNSISFLSISEEIRSSASIFEETLGASPV